MLQAEMKLLIWLLIVTKKLLINLWWIILTKAFVLSKVIPDGFEVIVRLIIEPELTAY